MIYGVKVIHTKSVGTQGHRVYEELILRIQADSADDAYAKADAYMQSSVCGYINPMGEPVKTLQIEAIDCFEAYDPEDGVEEVYSALRETDGSLPEDVYYAVLTHTSDL